VSEVSDAVRRLLIQRCGSRKTRGSSWSRPMPTDWKPEHLVHPLRQGETFTEDSAWQFIQDLLVEGCPIDVIPLDKPPNAKGYVIIVKGHPPIDKIYIKLQLTADKVWGRSFHESYPR